MFILESFVYAATSKLKRKHF